METLVKKTGVLIERRRSCISGLIGAECYGKPCVCLVCGNEDCMKCNGCYGREKDRHTEFCKPDDYDLE